MPNTLTSIGNNAFSGCTSLELDSLPDSLRKINAGAFAACNNITELHLTNLTVLATGAFAACKGLKKVIIDNMHTDTAAEQIRIFRGCNALEKVILLDGSFTGRCAFDECRSLITVGPLGGDYNIEYNFTDTIPTEMFAGAVTGLENTCTIKTVVLADNITKIANSAFAYSNVETINLDNVLSIDASAFTHCTELQLDHIPAKLTAIEARVFSRCSSIRGTDLHDGLGSRLIFPAKLNYVADNAFAYCSSLARVDIHMYSVPAEHKATALNNAWFLHSNSSLEIHVQASNPGDTIESRYGEYFNYWNNEPERKLKIVEDL